MTSAHGRVPSDDLAGIEDRVRGLLEERLHISVPANDTELFITGLVDSLGLVELLLALKEGFGVAIDIETIDFDELSSIERIAQTVLAATSAAALREPRS